MRDKRKIECRSRRSRELSCCFAKRFFVTGTSAEWTWRIWIRFIFFFSSLGVVWWLTTLFYFFHCERTWIASFVRRASGTSELREQNSSQLISENLQFSLHLVGDIYVRQEEIIYFIKVVVARTRLYLYAAWFTTFDAWYLFVEWRKRRKVITNKIHTELKMMREAMEKSRQFFF